MVMGSAASSDLKEFIGLDDQSHARILQDPLAAMTEEWMAHGEEKDKANWRYITQGAARVARDIPAHVKQTFITGKYHGGSIDESEYDTGHDGMTLDAFVEHDISKQAGLGRHHVAAARMYTSDSYPSFNRGLRRCLNPHPYKANVFFLDEALKKMRKVEAQLDPEAYASKMDLYRGMADMELDLPEFKRVGGNELALMSTSGSKNTALDYASQGMVSGLLLRLSTRGQSRGIRIQYLSLYPKENEYLFPPLTNLTFDDSSEEVEEDGVKVVPVVPMWS